MYSPADLNPRKHGVVPVSLNMLPLKTTKVSRAKLQGQGHARVKSVPASSIDRQAFLAQRVELMGPVRAFGDRVSFLPSLPSTASLPSRTLGYNHALVETVLRGRTFLQQFAGEYHAWYSRSVSLV